MKRVKEFTAPEAAGKFISELNRLVSEGENNTAPEVEANWPLFLIVGAPRSGTTVLIQWLSSVGIATPSNIAARFPQNPLFGGMLQRLLSEPDLNYRDELTIPPSATFESHYGKTSGLLAPHEYSFFFREYFPATVGTKLSEDERNSSDVAGFIRGLSTFGMAMNSAVAVKALLVQYDLDLLSNHPNIVFIHTQRDEADNVCSLLRHREKVAGGSDEWISVRPPEYEWLKDLSPVEQVAGQVHFTNEAIRKQASDIPGNQYISLPHTDFCADPKALHSILNDRLLELEFPTLGSYSGPESFAESHYDSDGEEYQTALSALDRVKAMAGDKH